jgi:hypothetical protein
MMILMITTTTTTTTTTTSSAARYMPVTIFALLHFINFYFLLVRSDLLFEWPRGQRCLSEAAGLLALRVRIPLGAWMSVSCEFCVLSGRGLCTGLVTGPEESYRVWCV